MHFSCIRLQGKQFSHAPGLSGAPKTINLATTKMKYDLDCFLIYWILKISYFRLFRLLIRNQSIVKPISENEMKKLLDLLDSIFQIIPEGLSHLLVASL